MNKKLLIILPALMLVSGCASGNSARYTNDCWYGEPIAAFDTEMNGEDYLKIEERGFMSPKDEPKSSFSLDSSGAAYTNLRRLINNKSVINQDQVIIEQMINYFDYDYASPTDSPVSVYTEMSTCPWNEENYLASIAVKTKQIEYENTKGNNYVLLVDTSGSMYSSNKLPLVKKGFKLLVDQLKEGDKVSIVTYSGNYVTLLDGGDAKDKEQIKEKIDTLSANGSTNGEGGITRAYALAKKHFIEGGTNQILLATDGDFNVGRCSVDELKELVEEESKVGISLSTFGFGMGNYKDSMMQTLALNGNGNVFYIDDEREMERTFGGDISSILKVVAKDAKIQISFDEDKVNKYRLIGYENRMMTEEEFNDENKDAGEIYSNKTVVALYEIIPMENETSSMYSIDFKYKDPSTNESKEILKPGSPYTTEPSLNHLFASTVAEFGLVLRDSTYKGQATLESVLTHYAAHEDAYSKDLIKAEFKDLIIKAKNWQLLSSNTSNIKD